MEIIDSETVGFDLDALGLADGDNESEANGEEESKSIIELQQPLKDQTELFEKKPKVEEHTGPFSKFKIEEGSQQSSITLQYTEKSYNIQKENLNPIDYWPKYFDVDKIQEISSTKEEGEQDQKVHQNVTEKFQQGNLDTIKPYKNPELSLEDCSDSKIFSYYSKENIESNFNENRADNTFQQIDNESFELCKKNFFYKICKLDFELRNQELATTVGHQKNGEVYQQAMKYTGKGVGTLSQLGAGQNLHLPYDDQPKFIRLIVEYINKNKYAPTMCIVPNDTDMIKVYLELDLVVDVSMVPHLPTIYYDIGLVFCQTMYYLFSSVLKEPAPTSKPKTFWDERKLSYEKFNNPESFQFNPITIFYLTQKISFLNEGENSLVKAGMHLHLVGSDLFVKRSDLFAIRHAFIIMLELAHGPLNAYLQKFSNSNNPGISNSWKGSVDKGPISGGKRPPGARKVAVCPTCSSKLVKTSKSNQKDNIYSFIPGLFKRTAEEQRIFDETKSNNPDLFYQMVDSSFKNYEKLIHEHKAQSTKN